VFERDFTHLVESLPSPARLDILEKSPGGDRERRCLVVVEGFERRSLGAAALLAKWGWRAKSVVCIRYGQSEMQDANRQHADDLRPILDRISSGNVVEILHDDHAIGSDLGTALLQAIAATGFDLTSAKTEVVFDITVGSSRLLLEGLHALLTAAVDLTVLYAEASEYRPSFAEYLGYLDERREREVPAPEFLAVGVDRVELLHRIPGRSADARPTYLIAFPSFTPIRIDAVLGELAANRVHWIFGVPHLVQNRWRLDAQRDYHEALIQRLHRHCYVSTFDYRESLGVLENIYRHRRRDYSVLVCSLGSKMQKLGQALFHVLRPEVGAVVSIPKRWNPERYSSDIPRAVYSVSLGNCEVLRRQLWETRTFKL
jgi:hypothetical protein